MGEIKICYDGSVACTEPCYEVIEWPPFPIELLELENWYVLKKVFERKEKR